MESSRNIKHSTSHFTMHLLFSKQSPPHLSMSCSVDVAVVYVKSTSSVPFCLIPLGLFVRGPQPSAAWTDSHTLKFPLKDLSILQQPDEKFFQMLGGFEWRYCILTFRVARTSQTARTIGICTVDLDANSCPKEFPTHFCGFTWWYCQWYIMAKIPELT